MRPLLIIDCNYLCHRARFTTGPLSYKGQATGVIFGFLNQLFTIGKETMPRNIIFTWDSRQSKRKRILSEYKGNRKKQDDDSEEDLEATFRQFHMLRKELLPNLGFSNNWMQVGYEADDLIAEICFTCPEEQIVIASSDDDLLQLLTEQVSIYNLGRKEFYTEQKFIEEYGIKPSQWTEVKKIAGCSSDNVSGISGVGEKTAIKYLKDELKSNTKTFQKIQREPDIIDRNEKLVKLPFQGTKIDSIEEQSFNAYELKRICKHFGFTKMINKLDDWNVLFGRT